MGWAQREEAEKMSKSCGGGKSVSFAFTACIFHFIYKIINAVLIAGPDYMRFMSLFLFLRDIFISVSRRICVTTCGLWTFYLFRPLGFLSFESKLINFDCMTGQREFEIYTQVGKICVATRWFLTFARWLKQPIKIVCIQSLLLFIENMTALMKLVVIGHAISHTHEWNYDEKLFSLRTNRPAENITLDRFNVVIANMPLETLGT